MIPYLGDFVEDDVVYLMFNTFTSDDPSASSTITNFINTDVHIHKDDGLTQRNNAAGITVSVDFDGITGSHLIKIDTNDNTVAGFWVTGADYFVRIEGTTVDAATVNAVVGHFSIQNRFMRGTDSAATATALTTHDGKLDTADTVVDGIQTDLSNATDGLGALKSLLDAIPTTAMRGTDGANTTVPDAAGVAPTAAEIKTEMEGAGSKILAIEGYTDKIDDATNGLTAIKAEVEGLAGAAMRGTDSANTTVPDAAGVAPTAVEIKAEVVAALQDIKLDHLLNIAVDTDWGTTVHLDSVIGHMADVGTAATFDRTTDALEALRNRGDAAWIAATGFSTHSAADVKTAVEQAGSSLAQILVDMGTTLDDLKRILGLDQENFYIDNPVFTGVHMTSCRIRLYSVAGSVGTAADVLATYNMTATYSGDNLVDYKVVKS